MLQPTRFFYFIITVFGIFLGIASRKIDGIPLSIGDLLYAVMVYFGFRMLFINATNPKKLLFPLVFCYLIELQQLYHAESITAIRNTTIGHYVLGQGFLWSDIVAYSVGVAIAFVVDYFLLEKQLP